MTLIRVNPSCPEQRKLLACVVHKVPETQVVRSVKTIRLTKDRVRKVITKRIVPTYGSRP